MRVGILRLDATGEKLLTLNLLNAGVANRTALTSDPDITEHNKQVLSRTTLDKLWWGDAKTPFYSPDKAEDMKPKKEDLVKVPFRLLSATIVAGGTWRATDFSDTKVLKASMAKLKGKPVFTNHNANPDNWLGIVDTVSWQPETIDATGMKIPAGINGDLALDIKTNPTVVRGALVGGIQSNSVTVVFKWKQSHEFPNDDRGWEFENRVGTFDGKGEMIRRVVTEIVQYNETSLVDMGADPYAKHLGNDGKPADVDLAHAFKLSLAKNSADRPTEGIQTDTITAYGDLSLLMQLKQAYSQQPAPAPKPKPTTKMKPEVLQALLLALGQADEANITEEMIQGLTGSPNEVGTLKATITDLTAQVDSLKAAAAFGTETLTASRNRVKALYDAKLAASGKTASQAMYKMIQAADTVADLEELAQEFGATLALTPSCPKCGEHNLNFRQTKQNEFDPEPVDSKPAPTKVTVKTPEKGNNPIKITKIV